MGKSQDELWIQDK